MKLFMYYAFVTVCISKLKLAHCSIHYSRNYRFRKYSNQALGLQTHRQPFKKKLSLKHFFFSEIQYIMFRPQLNPFHENNIGPNTRGKLSHKSMLT